MAFIISEWQAVLALIVCTVGTLRYVIMKIKAKKLAVVQMVDLFMARGVDYHALPKVAKRYCMKCIKQAYVDSEYVASDTFNMDMDIVANHYLELDKEEYSCK